MANFKHLSVKEGERPADCPKTHGEWFALLFRTRDNKEARINKRMENLKRKTTYLLRANRMLAR